MHQWTFVGPSPQMLQLQLQCLLALGLALTVDLLMICLVISSWKGESNAN